MEKKVQLKSDPSSLPNEDIELDDRDNNHPDDSSFFHQETSWDKFTKYLRGFFSVTTQLLIATLAVCLGLFLSCFWPTPILPTWVFETLIGIAIVGTGVSILSQPFILYWDYQDWRAVKVNYDPGDQKGKKKNGEYAAYNDSFIDYLSYHFAQRDPTTAIGKGCFWTAVVCTFVLFLFSLTYFLGEVPSIHFLAPGFDAMYHFLIVGFGPLLKLVGEPASLVTPLFAHIIGTIFVTSLPFIILELGRRIRGTPPELREEVVLDTDEPHKNRVKAEDHRHEITGFSHDPSSSTKIFFDKVADEVKLIRQGRVQSSTPGSSIFTN